jgi:integrase
MEAQITLYRSDDDYLFPSIAKNGSQPIQPDMILKRHIRPALERLQVSRSGSAGTVSGTGWVRCCRQKGVDIKTAQELLRHANSRITLDIYQQAVSEEKRVARRIWLSRDCSEGLILSTLQHPRRPD